MKYNQLSKKELIKKLEEKDKNNIIIDCVGIYKHLPRNTKTIIKILGAIALINYFMEER